MDGGNFSHSLIWDFESLNQTEGKILIHAVYSVPKGVDAVDYVGRDSASKPVIDESVR